MIDLHTHSKGSDGEKTPEELIDFAISNNIKALAITDHDTIDSIERAVNYAIDKEILLIPGIEFDTEFKNGEMHILGLFIDYKNEHLKQRLLKIKQERDERNREFIKEFNKIGFDVTLEELKKVSGGKIIGKPHFGKLFVEKKYIEHIEEVFEKYFNKSPFKDIPKTTYTPKEVIETIKESSGIAILAHPQTLNLNEEDLRNEIKLLKSYGLDGIECYHSKQTEEEMKLFKQIAEENDLVISKGSDYHRDISKLNIKIGTGINNNIVTNEDEKILDILIEKHKLINEE